MRYEVHPPHTSYFLLPTSYFKNMAKDKKIAKVSIVGAGPGDTELLTIKGLKAIQSADVILYDALVNLDLLEEARPEAIKIYVGKRASQHQFRQEEINEMLVRYAYVFGHVVRLKGGDPFVFGRGHEELAYVRAKNMPVAIIPGISSCIAVPTLQEVPLTRRGINESFWVVTATTRTGQLSGDIYLAAQSSATIIILMGLRKLGQIVLIFQQQERGALPIMLVQSGSTKQERYVVGTIDTIVEKVELAQLQTPAIIVIGEVVGLHPTKVLQQQLQIVTNH